MESKAIILVAGMGTRLKPRTLNTHKCLTKVNGIPIIRNTLEILSTAGIRETMLVIGYLGNEIQKEVGFDYKGMKISYVENEIYADTNTSYSLKMGLDALQDYDILYLLEGDVFFEDLLLRKLKEDRHENATMLEAYEPRLDGTFVEIGEDGFVSDWIHKSMREEGYTLEDKYKTINIHRFSKDFVDHRLQPTVDKFCDEMKGKAPLENVMREIVQNDQNIVYGLTSGGYKWFEIDDENDLKIAEDMFK